MPLLNIHHRTAYSFRQDVSLLPHRLMLTPREGRGLKLLSQHISTFPQAELNWSNDVFGNAIAAATFRTRSDSLVVERSESRTSPSRSESLRVTRSAMRLVLTKISVVRCSSTSAATRS